MCHDCDARRGGKVFNKRGMWAGDAIYLSDMAPFRGHAQWTENVDDGTRVTATGTAEVGEETVVWRIGRPDEACAIESLCKTNAHAVLGDHVRTARFVGCGWVCTKALVRKGLVDTPPDTSAVCVVTSYVRGTTLENDVPVDAVPGIIDYEHCSNRDFDNSEYLTGVEHIIRPWLDVSGAPPSAAILYRALLGLGQGASEACKRFVDTVLCTCIIKRPPPLFIPIDHAPYVPLPTDVEALAHAAAKLATSAPEEMFYRKVLIVTALAKACDTAGYHALDAHPGNILACPPSSV